MTAQHATEYGNAARKWMVDGQIVTNKITDPALQAAFSTVPREQFVPKEFAKSAYVDEPIPLGGGRYMAEPMVLAMFLQALKLKKTDNVLIVGGNLGYCAALIGGLVARITLADIAEFTKKATKNCASLAVEMTCENAIEAGAPANAPYDVILIEGSIGAISQSLNDQLAEGGRMAYGRAIGTHGHMAQLIIATKHASSLSEHSLGEAPLPRLAGFTTPSGFQFG